MKISKCILTDFFLLLPLGHHKHLASLVQAVLHVDFWHGRFAEPTSTSLEAELFCKFIGNHRGMHKRKDLYKPDVITSRPALYRPHEDTL